MTVIIFLALVLYCVGCYINWWVYIACIGFESGEQAVEHLGVKYALFVQATSWVGVITSVVMYFARPDSFPKYRR